MLLPEPRKTDLKGSPEGKVVPGFPTESVREFSPDPSSPTSASPIMVRRISIDDKAKLKAFSIENDSTGWLKKRLFKKEVTWPRELYLNVLGCKALVPQSAVGEGGPLTATASVTTDGENGDAAGTVAAAGVVLSGVGGDMDAKVIPERATPPPGGALGAGGGVVVSTPATADGAVNRTVSGSGSDNLSRGLDTDSEGGMESGDGATSSVGNGAEPVEDVNELMSAVSSHVEGGDVKDVKGECFVRVRNATTGRDLQTETVSGGANIGFHETFVVPCQGPRDAVVLEVFFGEGEKAVAIGDAALPLDARVVGVSHPVLLSVKDKQGRNRGFLRVETFWLDEAKPRKEVGEFYYKVVHPCGVHLRNQPCTGSDKSVHVLGCGEVFVACERQWHVGGEPVDGDCSPVFVKLMTSKDRWNRSGWCFETLCNGGGVSVPVLERASPPLRESGRYFFRVCNPEGARLHRKGDTKSKLRKELLPEGQVLEAGNKWTPAGSPVTFVTVVNGRGFIIQRRGEKTVINAAGEAAFEEVECPKSRVVSSVGVPEHTAEPPTYSATVEAADATAANGTAATASTGGGRSRRSGSSSPSKMRDAKVVDKIRAAEAAAAAASVRRLYRVREEAGVEATKTPDIVAPAADCIEAGAAFYGKAEVVKHYEGIGDVAFVMRETDGLWVRANRPGVALMLDVFTNVHEFGAYTYRVSHENGVVVRTAPGLDAPAVKPRRILPVTKLVNVSERLTRAEDIMNLSRPPIFLRQVFFLLRLSFRPQIMHIIFLAFLQPVSSSLIPQDGRHTPVPS
ncbi:unnamed protein product [Ectocarpus sp. 12 AP-2014]